MLDWAHFPLQAGERLVECSRVATPWQLDGVLEEVTGRLPGKSWAFVSDGFEAYEFAFENHAGVEPGTKHSCKISTML